MAASGGDGGGEERCESVQGAGGGGEHENRMSYSDRLKTNVNYNERLKRNLLEIHLERTDLEADLNLDSESIARVFKTLGIDLVSQYEGHQVQFRWRVSVISVWMKPGIVLDRFCKDVNIKVKPGVMTGMIKPAGQKDVTVTIIGVDFNTPDTFVIKYLNHFGKVSNSAVIYSKFNEGPFKGKYNGERKYQVDFTNAARTMGTFHLIDGCKTRIYYRGNNKTCGRCHKVARDCLGQGIAKDCDRAVGERVMLSSHMRQLWSEIGFVPTSFELETLENADDEDDTPNDAPLLEVPRFPSKILRETPTTRVIEQFDGITVKNIPTRLDDKDIFEFLFNYGLPDDHGIEQIRINKDKKNTWVVIDGLAPEDVNTMYDSIHFPKTRQKFFDVPIYCRPLRNMTPTKAEKKTESPAKKSLDDVGHDEARNITPNTPSPASSKSKPSGLSKSQ